MSNLPATTNTTLQVPEHIAKRIAARKGEALSSPILDALSGAGKFPYPKVSIRAGRFRLVEDSTETMVGITLPVVIVGANPNVSKTYYSKPYDPNATDARPDCFSNDGIVPDPSVQNPISKSCSSCSHNVIGSKMTPSGAKTTLCNSSRHLAVVPSADPTKLYALSIPVSSLRALREYVTTLKNYGVKPEEAVTTLGFDETTSYPRITFTQGGWPSTEGLQQIEQTMVEKADQIKEITREKPLGTATSAMLTGGSPVAAAVLEAPAEGEGDFPFDVEHPVEESSALNAKLDDLFGS